MKRLAGIILLLLMTYNFVGYLPAFYSMQSKVKREMRRAARRNANRKDLSVLSFSLADNKVADTDFSRIDEHEFSYKGEMYDIVRSEKTGNTITFYCLHDKKETHLLAKLHQFVKQNSAENPFRESSKLYNSFCKLEFISAGKLAFSIPQEAIQSILQPYRIWKSAKHITPFSPPPEMFV